MRYLYDTGDSGGDGIQASVGRYSSNDTNDRNDGKSENYSKIS